MTTTRTRRFTLCALVMFLAALGWTSAAAQDQQTAQASANAPQKSYVLTRLGAISEGVLIDRGTSYLLEFEGGGSTMISKIDALFVGPTRESVFQYKMEQTRMEDVNEVLKLADWASRRQLGAEAIVVLRQKFDSSKDPAERQALQRKIDDLVLAESFRADAAKATANRVSSAQPDASVDRRQNLAPEDAELDAWSKPIPLPTLERFSRKAQPILQKRCSSADCHGPGANTNYSVRPRAVGAAARFALLHNLRETLDYVEFDDFEQSPILNHPEVLNAKGERVYPFGDDRSSLRDCENFVEWLNSLKTETVLADHAKTTKRERGGSRLRQGASSRYDVAERPTAADQGTATQYPESESFSALFESDENSSASNGTFGFGISAEAQKYMPKPEDDPNSQEAILQRVGMRPQKTYRDDYDPEIFNDRYHNNSTSR